MNIFCLCNNSSQILNYDGNYNITRLNSLKDMKQNTFHIGLLYFSNEKEIIRIVENLEKIIKIPYIIITNDGDNKKYGISQIDSVKISEINKIDKVILKYLKQKNDISILSLVELMQILNTNKKSVAIKVMNKNNNIGLIVFKDGNPIHARLNKNKLDGNNTIYKILSWDNPTFKLTKLPTKVLYNLKNNINIDLVNLLMNANKYKEELEYSDDKTIVPISETDIKQLKIEVIEIFKGFDKFINISIFKNDKLILSEYKISNKEFKDIRHFLKSTTLIIKKVKFGVLKRVILNSSIITIIEYEKYNDLLIIIKLKKDANVSIAKILSNKVKQLFEN